MEMTHNGRDTEQYHHHLGLGLGLGLGLSLGMADTTSPVEALGRQQQQSWNGAGLFFPASSGERRTHADDRRLAALPCHEMPFLRGIDVSRAPAMGDARGSCAASEDEEPGDSMARSGGGEQKRAGAGSYDEDDSGSRAGGAGLRKNLRLSRDQSAVLKETFKEDSTLNPVTKQQKVVLARQLGLRPRQVEVWFQNRRARTKLKQTAVGCEALKRCCETLTEENLRLQWELRALKLLAPPAPHLYMPTTLAMCPSCERVAPSGKPCSWAGRPAQRS